MTEPAMTEPATTEPAAPEAAHLPLPRWLAPLTVLCLVTLLPWIAYLAVTLPRRTRADHYDLAWVGFDIGMWFALAGLAWCAHRRLPAIGPVAAVAATLLVVDAWFDVVTSATAADRMQAALSAVLVELPLAVICGWVAVNAERVRTRAYRRLRRRVRRAEAVAGLTAPGETAAPTGDGVSEPGPPPLR